MSCIKCKKYTQDDVMECYKAGIDVKEEAICQCEDIEDFTDEELENENRKIKAELERRGLLRRTDFP
tara:strand:+ start:1738 stop:1938 length:201 start_codon:yes stop_codon:yes gene_type:complete